MVTVPALMWTPFPQNKLRIVVTIVSAGLIYIGSFHQTVLLTHHVLAYIGNISYALYLFHWPLYVIFRSVSCQPFLALFMGVIVSVILAIATFHFFECYYLKWPIPVVVSVIAILWTSSAVLSRQLLRDDSIMKISRYGSVKYEGINPNDAAWNRSKLIGLQSRVSSDVLVTV
ncbi:hypothetical protein ANCCAN_06657 [Ancylostoma caninum]|uniref:Acyltransferase 3 domain-containing protein n=1 Tax=Ancylostoma caninum TaxID=29170 RepID=A0A368GVJ8_ANCCA|nr:hypothetical protein ANCCAN_06657 [Ancylostoma caninum]